MFVEIFGYVASINWLFLDDLKRMVLSALPSIVVHLYFSSLTDALLLSLNCLLEVTRHASFSHCTKPLFR